MIGNVNIFYTYKEFIKINFKTSCGPEIRAAVAQMNMETADHEAPTTEGDDNLTASDIYMESVEDTGTSTIDCSASCPERNYPGTCSGNCPEKGEG